MDQQVTRFVNAEVPIGFVESSRVTDKVKAMRQINH
jgi:hypothetical protein